MAPNIREDNNCTFLNKNKKCYCNTVLCTHRGNRHREEVKEFYGKLQEAIEKVSKKDTLVVMEDMNSLKLEVIMKAWNR
jgi:hypothetical protein